MGDGSRSGLMARLTLSAVADATQDSSGWSQPEVHRALLVSGLLGGTLGYGLWRLQAKGAAA